MKKTITFSVIVIVLSITVSAQITKRALFLGNSYTSVNNLPQVIANVANSVNDTLLFDSNTPGGYYLLDHLVIDTISTHKIKTGNWDYVVLQDQSLAYSVGTPYLPSACELDTLIKLHNSCAQTMFYITWGRKNGAIYFCQPPECDSIGYIQKTYYEMDSIIEKNYMFAADSLKALASPVGAVWRYIRQNYPSIELFQLDGSHPSEAGTYAAACCFYTAMFKKNPLAIPYNFTLSATDAANIRTSVKAIVYNNFLNWNIGANFSYFSSIGNMVTFKNLSSYATSYNWDFGDGNTSTTNNPVHTYLTNGNYTVTLITNYCTYSDTITQVINTSSSTGINDNYFQNSITFYPNPASDLITIKASNSLLGSTYIITEQTGKQILTGKLNNETTSVDISQLATGVYLFQVGQQRKQTFKVIKK